VRWVISSCNKASASLAFSSLAQLQGLIDEPQAQSGSETFQEQVARQLALAKYRALVAEQNSLQQELVSHPSRLEVSTAVRDWVNQALADADLKLRTLNTLAQAAQTSASEEKARDADALLQDEMTHLTPGMRVYAQQNRELAEQLKNYSSELEQSRDAGLSLASHLEDIEQDFSLMRRRLEVAGRKGVLGKVMLSRLDKLPAPEMIRRDIRDRNSLIAERSLNQIDVDEELSAIGSLNQYLADRFPGTDPASSSTIAVQEKLADQRRELLSSIYARLKALLGSLVEENESANSLIKLSKEFHQFLVGNLMWVQSFDYLNLPTFYLQLSAILSPREWLQVPEALVEGFKQNSWSIALLVLLVMAILARRPAKAMYESLLGAPALLNVKTLWNIVLCLLLLMLRIAPEPMALFIAGEFISFVQPSRNFLEGLAPTLKFAASGLFILLLAKSLVSPTGVGRRLLKWDARMLDKVREELRWAGPLTLLAMIMDVFAIRLDLVSSGGPLGAITTAIVAVTIVIFSLRLIRLEIFNKNQGQKIFLRLSALLGIMVLLLLISGLLFAAELYLRALIQSTIMVLTIKVISDVFERALLILRARLERLAKDELKAKEEGGEDTAAAIEEQMDVSSLSEAHAKLLTLGRLTALFSVLWIIWSPGLPALSLLEAIPLWEITDATNQAGGTRVINLFDLVLGIIILMVTFLVARHLPSLVQVFLMEWVKVSSGGRYATSILMQYFVVAVGISMFLDTVGWEWNNLQWLVAALGVGIGFGLQEIVANFISGIIILFEQPIRVGDIISAGGTEEGRVTKISARATVIQTFEGKEHLIPNKELITGQVINWSLTENAVRVVVPVGVAYGSDVRKAMDLLLEAAQEVDLVLKEPLPTATFEDFGDNALLLWLRCFVSEQRPAAWTQLRTLINDKFNKAGIVIAFPQRDLHVDFSESLRVQLEGNSSDS